MKNTILFLLFSVTLACISFCQDTSFSKEYVLGETKVLLDTHCFIPCKSGVLFINLHDNEKSSVQAAEYHLLENGGKLVHIQNNGERIITFTYKRKKFSFDPNRIYSLAGINSTLKLLSNKPDAGAAKEISNFASVIKKNFIDSSMLIIALHNNRDSDLSVNSYQQEQALQKHWGNVYINPLMDADDFILTTDSTIFKKIKEKNINVVWENVDLMKDDGSLSIYAGRKKIPYINIEAEHNHTDEQCAMLRALADIVKEYDKQEEENEENIMRDSSLY